MKNSLITLMLLALWSCQPSQTEETHHDDLHEHDDAGDHHDEVHLLQRQMDVMDIQLGHFQQLDLKHTVKSNGRLELPPQKRANVTALLGGRVKQIDVFPGRFVRKGQVLAQLEQPEFIDLQERYLSLQSQVAFLGADVERKRALAKDSLSSMRSLQQAEAAHVSALAGMQAAAAKLALLGIEADALRAEALQQDLIIRAPIAGYIRSIDVNTGSYVLPQQSMFEIVDNDHIHIDLMVYEKDMQRIEVGQEVMFHLAGQPDSVFRGGIFAVGKAFEEEPRAMKVHAEINNTGGLLPGMYVDARIITGEQTVTALPEDAVVSNAGLHYIFVLEDAQQTDHAHGDDGERIFHMVEVSAGVKDMGFIEVVPADPLTPQDRIVTKGAYYLLAEYLKSQGGAEHHH